MFATESAAPKEISTQALVILHNGTPGESLDSLCHKCFYEKVSTNTSCIHPQTLPPTSAAAKYHSLWVYFQILEWKVVVTKLGLWNGDRRKVMENLCQYSPTCHQLQMNPWKWSGVTVTLTAAVWGTHVRNENVKCSPACGNCRGSGWTTQTIPYMRMKMT